jgi:type IV secretory pathway TrbD component
MAATSRTTYKAVTTPLLVQGVTKPMVASIGVVAVVTARLAMLCVNDLVALLLGVVAAALFYGSCLVALKWDPAFFVLLRRAYQIESIWPFRWRLRARFDAGKRAPLFGRFV